MSDSKKALVVFEGYPAENILRQGGSFSWDLNPDRAKQCDYLICCCSTKDSELKGSAFLIGKISDVVPSPEEIAPHRWMIKISEYALVNISNVWKGWQNPVHYFSDEEIQEFEEKLGKSLDKVDFQPLLKTLTINKAKSDLAKVFGVDVNAIEIIIRV
ncbi:hypothetical protein Cri9333_0231 [Crinalium epipsammum PCC 9333]|uniref:Uncharacterized protein n=1 Tax=Crinalium epipsammum PCC 9333 TaxID=1173022 RepID=K9VUS4_9CYAN|nr:hypothetical protein [Crinalium epipsammum]AFZ11227.1 hypothetical protein Cri9333_0231 [Crinalium epipsammum PCC 9333]